MNESISQTLPSRTLPSTLRTASPLSFFASKSITVHLLRGAAATALLFAAVKVGEQNELLSIALGIAAVVMLRGCPMCWTIGLIETVRTRHSG